MFIVRQPPLNLSLFFFNDTATTEIYTLSLHDALPISEITSFIASSSAPSPLPSIWPSVQVFSNEKRRIPRSEEHTSELQSPCNLVCRLLLEKKKNDQRPLVAQRNLRSSHPVSCR